MVCVSTGVGFMSDAGDVDGDEVGLSLLSPDDFLLNRNAIIPSVQDGLDFNGLETGVGVVVVEEYRGEADKWSREMARR